MRLREKILISVTVGLLAMTLRAVPMWWGVLFTPISQSLACEMATEETLDGYCWKVDGVVFRFRSLDLLRSFLNIS